MIHVDEQPEPVSFNGQVRQKGLAWLQQQSIPLDQPCPKTVEIKPYWRSCLEDLHESYSGCCAYLAVFFERCTGGGSVDHFIAKSNRADLTYEWSNYRLACSRMNSRKRDFDDVLDPFEIETGWFRLEPVTGRIYPNPTVPKEQQTLIQATIDRLSLDDAGCREIRARHYQEYREEQYTAEFFKKRSPFVYAEAQRQGLL